MQNAAKFIGGGNGHMVGGREVGERGGGSEGAQGLRHLMYGGLAQK